MFKPKIDNRYSDSEIVSHSGAKVPCLVVEKAQDILKKIEADTEVVAIDEVQFFDKDIVEVCEYLADKGIRVMVAGLDKDFRGESILPRRCQALTMRILCSGDTRAYTLIRSRFRSSSSSAMSSSSGPLTAIPPSFNIPIFSAMAAAVIL